MITSRRVFCVLLILFVVEAKVEGIDLGRWLLCRASRGGLQSGVLVIVRIMSGGRIIIIIIVFLVIIIMRGLGRSSGSSGGGGSVNRR